MPICSLLGVDDEKVSYQWFSKSGKIRDEDQILWADISVIEVFKRDMFAYDLICLTIKYEGGEPVEIDEEDPHWDIFVGKLHKRLDGAQPWGKWFSNVAFPAFTANAQTIYTRRKLGEQGGESDG